MAPSSPRAGWAGEEPPERAGGSPWGEPEHLTAIPSCLLTLGLSVRQLSSTVPHSAPPRTPACCPHTPASVETYPSKPRQPHTHAHTHTRARAPGAQQSGPFVAGAPVMPSPPLVIKAEHPGNIHLTDLQRGLLPPRLPSIIFFFFFKLNLHSAFLLSEHSCRTALPPRSDLI